MFVVAILAISSSAFAQMNGPVRQGSKCLATTDQRGFGFLDQCADAREIAERGRQDGRRGRFHEARTAIPDSFGNGGGGGAGGGGNGR